MYKKIFYYLVFLIIIFVLSGSSTKNSKDKPLLLWKNKQTQVAYKIITESQEYYIGLGIGVGTTWQTAKEDAEFEARNNIAETIEIFIKTVSTLYTKEDNNKIDEDFKIFIFSKTTTQIKEPIIYKELSRFKYGEDYYVAIIAKKNRNEYFDDYILGFTEFIINKQISQETLKLIDSANKKYLELLNESNTLKK